MNRHTKVIQDERIGDLGYSQIKVLAAGFPGMKSKSAITIGAVALKLILSMVSISSLFAQDPITWETGHEIWEMGSYSIQHHSLREPVVLRDVFVPRAAFGHLYQSRWIAVGDSGMIVSGSAVWNGNSTTIRSNRTESPTTADLYAVCNNKTAWIAVGKGGSIVHGTSFNLGAWNLTTVGDSVQLIDVESDGTNWVSVGWDASPEKAEETTEGWIVTSKDAVDWSIQTFPGVHILSVTNDGKKWLAGGYKVDDHGKKVPILLESANAETWVSRALRTTHVPEDSMVRHISYGGDYWVAVMESQVAGEEVESWLLESEDGNEWTEILHQTGAASKPCFGGSEWCFLLNQTLENSQAAPQTLMLISKNRKDWISTRPDLPGDFVGLAVSYMNGRRLLTGSSSSFAFVTQPFYGVEEQFTIERTNIPLGTAYYKVNDIEESDGQWVSVGMVNSTKERRTIGDVSVSSNGYSWEPVLKDMDSVLNRVIKRNGTWVAVGDRGEIWTSTNATDWIKIHENKELELLDVEYAQGRWVVVGAQKWYPRPEAGVLDPSKGVVLTSNNLLDWETSHFGRANNMDHFALGKVAFGNGLWIVHGLYTSMLKSTNAEDWTSFPYQSNGNSAVISLSFGNGLWMASHAFSNGQGYSTDLKISTNGFDWDMVGGPFNGGPVWFEDGRWWMATLPFDSSFNSDIFLLESFDGIHWGVVHQLSKKFPDFRVIDKRIYLDDGQNLMVLTPSIRPRLDRPHEHSLHQAIYGAQRWVGIGGEQNWVSEDGINWFHSFLKPDGLGRTIKEISFGDEQWGILESSDQNGLEFYTYKFDTNIGNKRYTFKNLDSGDNARALEYRFHRWWLLTSRGLVSMDASFSPNIMLDNPETLNSLEQFEAIAFSNDSVKVLTNQGTMVQSDTRSEFSDWVMSRISDRTDSATIHNDWTFHDVAYGKGIWQTVSIRKEENQSTLWLEQSTDGKQWNGQAIRASSLKIDSYFKVAYANGWWVLCGGGGAGEDSAVEIYISQDTTSWQRVHSLKSESIPKSLKFGGKQWIVTLSDGTMLRSGPEVWLSAESGDSQSEPRLKILGSAQKEVSLQYSTDLKKWHHWKKTQTDSQPSVINLPGELKWDDIFIKSIHQVEP